MTDRAYQSIPWSLPEMPHAYGAGVHLLADPVSLSLLARLCTPEQVQPAFNQVVSRLYRTLVHAAVNHAFPRKMQRVETRMAALSEAGVIEAELIDPSTKVVCVDIARAGILPSAVCFDFCNELLDPSGVRQDHLVMSRATDPSGAVKGATLHGEKIGGSINDAFVLIPDPMGATGTSICSAIDYYRRHHGDAPSRIIALHLIVTPQYLRRIRDEHPDVMVFALRLDRGMSSIEVLSSGLGEHWGEEDGLTDEDYIVPGGGGFGELMNNSWV